MDALKILMVDDEARMRNKLVCNYLYCAHDDL